MRLRYTMNGLKATPPDSDSNQTRSECVCFSFIVFRLPNFTFQVEKGITIRPCIETINQTIQQNKKRRIKKLFFNASSLFFALVTLFLWTYVISVRKLWIHKTLVKDFHRNKAETRTGISSFFSSLFRSIVISSLVAHKLFNQSVNPIISHQHLSEHESETLVLLLCTREDQAIRYPEIWWSTINFDWMRSKWVEGREREKWKIDAITLSQRFIITDWPVIWTKASSYDQRERKKGAVHFSWLIWSVKNRAQIFFFYLNKFVFPLGNVTKWQQ